MLAGQDLVWRCQLGLVPDQRTERKRVLTEASSSRWAGAITRTSNDQWQRGYRNLLDARASLRRAARKIDRRLRVPIGGRHRRARGYASHAERYQKQRRLQHLTARLTNVERRLADGRVSVCRGGRRLAKLRHHLDQTGMSVADWCARWQAERWFLTADGEAAKPLGNETIRVHPEEGWLELKLPSALAHLVNRPHDRYRLHARYDSAIVATNGPRRWPAVQCGTTSTTDRIGVAGIARQAGLDRHYQRSPCSRRSTVGSSLWT